MPSAGAGAGPFAGLVVVDLTRNIAGPLTTMAMADLGAEVIKVESENLVDLTRSSGTKGSQFVAVNRNKRAVCVDMKAPAGLEIIRRLIDRADVLVEAFRPGVTHRLGLDYDTLAVSCPRLVYASLTAYGSEGPRAGEGGFDFVMQAETGMMSVTGDPDGSPLPCGFQAIDHAASLAFGEAIAIALYERERTGRGTRVEVNLFDTALFLQATKFTEHSVTNRPMVRTGPSLPHASVTEVFSTRTDPLVITAVIPHQFEAMCDVLGVPWVAHDPRFAQRADRQANRVELNRILAGRFVESERDEWLTALAKRGVIAAAVRSYDEVVADPQVDANSTFIDFAIDGASIRTVRVPYSVGGHQVQPLLAPPALGSSTAAVLSELGYSDLEVAGLQAAGVVYTGEDVG